MESKKCRVCRKEKPLTDFYYRKDSEKYREDCKKCFNEKRKKQGKEWRKNNTGKIKEYHRKYYIENKKDIDKKNREWSKNNREKENKQKRKWREKNKDKVKGYCKRWKERNGEYFKRPEFIEKERMRNRERRKNPIFRLNQNLSRNINYSLKSKSLSKNGRKWEKILGYTTQDLKEHLEKQFLSGITWENYGSKWHVDHIIPKDFFQFKSTDDVEFKYCWSLNNLQPLWGPENIRKSNKVQWK